MLGEARHSRWRCGGPDGRWAGAGGGPSGGLGGAPGTREKGPAGTDGMGGPWREKLPTEKAVGMLGNVIQYFTGS